MAKCKKNNRLLNFIFITYMNEIISYTDFVEHEMLELIRRNEVKKKKNIGFIFIYIYFCYRRDTEAILFSAWVGG